MARDTGARPYGRWVRRNLRTRSIVRAFNSGGSRHGNTVISAFGHSEATSTEDTSGWAGGLVWQDEHGRLAGAREISRHAINELGPGAVKIMEILLDLRHGEVWAAAE
jgi:hypothetical protein